MLTNLTRLLRVFMPALVLLSAVAILVGCDVREEALAVNRGALTQLGEVVGVASPFDPEITVYRGIPYAAPPVGERRWQPPQSAEPWQQAFEQSINRSWGSRRISTTLITCHRRFISICPTSQI